MSNDIDLATALFGNKRVENGVEPTVKIMTGTAVSDSSNGTVKVVIDGVTTGDTIDDELQDNVIELDTNPNVKEGDIVQITAYGGVSNSMVVTGVIGRGDSMKTDIDNAQNSADDAKTSADDARKVATNYIDIDENKGITVGNMTEDTLGKNTYIDANGVQIRDGETVLASFEDDEIQLGSNSSYANISMCGGKGKFSYTDTTGFSIMSTSSKATGGGIFIYPASFSSDGSSYSSQSYFDAQGNTFSLLKNETSTKKYTHGNYQFDADQFKVTLWKNTYQSTTNDYTQTLLLNKDGLFYNGGKVYGETVLYNNTSGTNSTVTLSESAANFTYLEIFFNYDPTNLATQCASYTKIYSPNGKYVSLSMDNQATSANAVQNLCEIVQISGTQIKRTTSQGWFINGLVSAGSASSGKNSNNHFYIQRVVGIK